MMGCSEKGQQHPGDGFLAGGTPSAWSARPRTAPPLQQRMTVGVLAHAFRRRRRRDRRRVVFPPRRRRWSETTPSRRGRQGGLTAPRWSAGRDPACAMSVWSWAWWGIVVQSSWSERRRSGESESCIGAGGLPSTPAHPTGGFTNCSLAIFERMQ